MRRLLPFMLLALAFLGCKRNDMQTMQSATSTDSITESVAADSDSVSLPEPPAAADGVFDDFMFNWMNNKHFQLERTAFPLPVVSKQGTSILSASEWKHEPLFSKREVYTMIFDNEKSMKNISDTAVKCVVVEMIKLREKSSISYMFTKQRGAWRLSAIKHEELSENKNSDFLDFYQKFASSEKFQKQHVARSFELSVIDPDSYEHIKGTADANQWTLYAPVFPTDVMTNVNYGQEYGDTGERVLVVSSVDGMMSSTITFRKRGSQWLAVKLENN